MDDNEQARPDRSASDPPDSGQPRDGQPGDGRDERAGASGEGRSGERVQPPPRRGRQRVEHELDELRETVDELRDELAALRSARDDHAHNLADGTADSSADSPADGASARRGRHPSEASTDHAGPEPGGNPGTVAELHQQLYREPNDDDPGGDIVMLTSVVSEHSAALQELDLRQPVLPCWAEMDREQATKAWDQLVDWLCGVLIVRYPASARTLRPCWYLHPELVENLSWLHNAWTLAYRDGNSSISMAADWHLYWLPHVMRIAGEATRKCYDAGRHDPNSDPDLTAANAVGISEDLTAHVHADLRNRPDPDDPTPRGYVVPPARPVAPPPWSTYRRDPSAPTEGPGPRPGQPYPPPTHQTPPGAGRGGTTSSGPNPYQPR